MGAMPCVPVDLAISILRYTRAVIASRSYYEALKILDRAIEELEKGNPRAAIAALKPQIEVVI